MVSKVILEDIAAICEDRQEELKTIAGSTWLISGGGGFLGGYFLDLLWYCNEHLLSKPCRVLCIENFCSGTPRRIKHLEGDRNIQIVRADIVKPLQFIGDVDYIIHAASIASPTYYRKYPLETIETNVLGLRNLLKLGEEKPLKSFLFLSSSEIYGDPPANQIPTREDYNGNVSCTGPRACYDESKRLGETLAVNWYRRRAMPIKIVRPFNVYGPGLRLEDKRVLPDFFRDALLREKIVILSDGTPTRSFCYVRDAVAGFLAALLSEFNGEAFNIGNDQEEVSMKTLAGLVAETVGNVEVEFGLSPEAAYLEDNPRRRCPDLSKARTLLNYRPRVSLQEGLVRSLKWYREEYGKGDWQ